MRGTLAVLPDATVRAIVKWPASTYMQPMWSYSKNPVLHGATDQKKPERRREDVLAKAAEIRLQRDRDASQALKEYAAAKLETLAKTARLRSERLAREAAASKVKSAAKIAPSKKS